MYLAHHLVPPQVHVTQTRFNNSWGGYYLTVNESDGNITVCVQTDGIVRELLYIHVETTHTNSSDYPPAIGNTCITEEYVCIMSLVLIYIFPHIS